MSILIRHVLLNNKPVDILIKNNKIELADKVVSNTNNLDVLTALNEVLNKYPDVETKVSNFDKLLASGEIKAENKNIIENILQAN